MLEAFGVCCSLLKGLVISAGAQEDEEPDSHSFLSAGAGQAAYLLVHSPWPSRLSQCCHRSEAACALVGTTHLAFTRGCWFSALAKQLQKNQIKCFFCTVACLGKGRTDAETEACKGVHDQLQAPSPPCVDVVLSLYAAADPASCASCYLFLSLTVGLCTCCLLAHQQRQSPVGLTLHAASPISTCMLYNRTGSWGTGWQRWPQRPKKAGTSALDRCNDCRALAMFMQSCVAGACASAVRAPYPGRSATGNAGLRVSPLLSGAALIEPCRQQRPVSQ